MTSIVRKKSASRISGCQYGKFIGVSILLVLGCTFIYRLLTPARDEIPTDSSPMAQKETSDPSKSAQVLSWENNEEIKTYREYLRIPTVHPNVDYEPCVKFLKEQAKRADLPVEVYYPVNDKNPLVVMTWIGAEPNLKSIVLNTHMDVVPVSKEFWSHKPFAAEMDKDGNIFARGAQDTKAAGMQYLAAIRALKKDGITQLKRTIHVLFVPDEEMGSHFGMREFVHTEQFKALNVTFALDEGGCADSNNFLQLYFAERSTWRIEFICHGESGHGSIMFENTAAKKLFYLIKKFDELREIEAVKDKSEDITTLRNVTSINLTVVKGGLEGNVVPAEMSAIFDVRLALDADHQAFDKMINQWCEEAGGNITIKFHIKDPKTEASIVDDTNPFYTAITKSIDELHLKIKPKISSAGSDSRFMRSVGIQSFNFAPMLNTTFKMHGNDEYLNAKVFLNGIEVYKKIIPNIANVSDVSVPISTRMEKKLNIEQLNQLNSTEFLNIFKNVIELWPKAAESVYKQKPFPSLTDFADKFDSYLESLSVEDKVAILCLHPDLTGKLLDQNNVTQESAEEQASAGLNQLTAEQKKQLVQLNAEYRKKFDFPFVICVRQNNKIEKILEGFVSRLPNTKDEEIINGTNEVKKIGRLRLANIVDL